MRERVARLAKWWPVALLVTWHDGTLTVFALWGAPAQTLLAGLGAGALLGPLVGRLAQSVTLPGQRADDNQDVPTVDQLTPDDRPALPGPLIDTSVSYSPLMHAVADTTTPPYALTDCDCPKCETRRSNERDTP